MPTPKYFEACPAFPSDVPVADIPSVSLRALAEESGAERDALWDACRQHGFFQLRLDESATGRELLGDAEGMLDLTSATLDLDRATLDQFAYQPPNDLLGYKAAGKLKTDDGRMDTTELYTIGQDDMLGLGAGRANPAPVEAARPAVRRFLHRAHSSVSVILRHLDAKLGLAEGTLERCSALDRPSATSLRLLLTRPQAPLTEPGRVTLGGHTDIGTITLLFHVAGGLQILPAGKANLSKNWRYIRPEPGHALVNLGDTLVEWTGGILRSSLHRVVTAPGQQSAATRRSLAYLIRPARDCDMRRLGGDGSEDNERGSKSIIPRAQPGQEDTRSADEWAAWRTMQIIRGELKPQTNGGAPVAVS